VTLGTAAVSAAVGTNTVAATARVAVVSLASVAARAGVLTHALAEAGDEEAAERLRAAALAVPRATATARPAHAEAAPERAPAKAAPADAAPAKGDQPTDAILRPPAGAPRVAPAEDDSALQTYVAAEERALAELREAKARRLRLLEIARRLAAARPAGVEVVDHRHASDGRVILSLVSRAARVDVVVITAATGDVQILADAPGQPVVKTVGGQAEAVCAGLDEIFEPLLRNARADGLHAERTRRLGAHRPPPASAARTPGRGARQKGR
jgi:hypothetical protein